MLQPSLVMPGTAGDRLQQIEAARRAVLGSDDTVPPQRLAPWIERSWRRCLARGMHPGEPIGFHPVPVADLRSAMADTQRLRQVAEPLLARLARTMADAGHVVLLADARGVVVAVYGSPDHDHRRVPLIAREGMDLSEASAGTNAIALALAEGRPVWLHRGEHFHHEAGACSGAGVPVFGPDGRCVAVLGLIGVDVPERPALQHLLARSALDIETAWLLAQPHRLQLRLNWPGHGPSGAHEGLLILDAEGQIRGANRAAADMLALPPAPWPHGSEVFVDAVARLFDAARQRQPETEWPLWSGLRIRVLARLPGDAGQAPCRPAPAEPVRPLRDMEVALIRQAVEAARGNVMQAARTLGISRATVYRKLQRRDPA